MNLPTGKEIDRAWRAVEAAYQKWYLLRTGRDTQTLRKNELLIQMQRQAQKIRKKEVLRRVRKVRFKVNQAVPHIQIRIPGVNAD